jgi:hypothetical protein
MTMTMTTMNVSNLLNSLKGVQGVLVSIFEYDDTYKQIFDKQIKTELWRESWKQWYYKIDCPYERSVAGYLTENWGVWHDSSVKPASFWFSRHHFTDSISINKYIDINTGNMMVYVSMKLNNSMIVSVFRGMVLTKKQHKKECLEDNRNEIQYIDVYEDSDSEMVVYVNLM